MPPDGVVTLELNHYNVVIVDSVTHHHQPFSATLLEKLIAKIQNGFHSYFLVRRSFCIHFLDLEQQIPISRINVN